MACIALYYPYIHFQSDTWLKRAALFWDRVARIVPTGVSTSQDSEVARQLSGELNLIHNVDPEQYVLSLREPFCGLLREHGDALAKRYALQLARAETPGYALALDPTGEVVCPASMYASKLPYTDIGKELLDRRLALRLADPEGELLLLHPRLADVCGMVLADTISQSNGYLPVTDRDEPYLALGNLSASVMVNLLLDGERAIRSTPAIDPTTELIASVCLQAVLPANLSKVPVESLIRLRKTRRDELSQFQQWTREAAGQLVSEMGQAPSVEAIRLHLSVFVDKEVTPQLRRMQRIFREAGLKATLGVLTVRPDVPKLMLAGGCAAQGVLPPVAAVAAGTAAAALALIPIAQDAQARAKEELRTGAGYLLHVRDATSPSGVASRLARRARNWVFDA